VTRTVKRLLMFSFLGIFLGLSIVVAQEHAASGSSSAQADPATKSEQQKPSENPNAEFGEELAKTSKEAAKETSTEDTVLAMELRAVHSPVVSWIGRVIKIGPERAYLLSLLINFGILIAFFWVLLKGKIPQMFRDRTAAIQKGIKEAQAASADAARRLKEIEERLAKLDTEVAEIRSSAEGEAAAEEARIRQAAEEDKHRVVQSVEMEIDAIARNARRELKSYAANLAVDLASRKIQVDERTDHALVREFVDHFGKDGK
jgi:F-type H+-transporting ATPase subunit b